MIVSMIMLVVVMAVIVQGMRRRDRGADGSGAMQRCAASRGRPVPSPTATCAPMRMMSE